MGKIPLDQLIGKKIGFWTILRQDTSKKLRYFFCKCDCGTEKSVRLNILRSGKTLSCGCYQRKLTSSRGKTHGHTTNVRNTIEYGVWVAMLWRCTNPKNIGFDNYMGRGIRVCKRWHTYGEFLLDMGERPTSKHSIDRIDNDANYSCGKCDECIENGWKVNCKWSTKREQDRNKRTNRWIEHDGRKMILADWASEFKIKKNELHYYLKRHPIEVLAAKYELRNHLDVINKKYAST